MRQSILPIILFIFFLFPCCNDGHKKHMTQNEAYYTCPMHPSVVSTSPGSCPVCNMSLIKVEKNSIPNAKMNGNVVTIDKLQQRLAGIILDTVSIRSLTSSTQLLGTVAIDEESVKTISCRVNGRIEKLHAKSTGQYIKSGSPLYSIYSEQLLSDEKEYLNLLGNVKHQKPNGMLHNELIRAARNKLLLWGLSESQILDLETKGTTSPFIQFVAPASGYITEINIKEGEYVSEGTLLFKLIGLNQVWIEVQVYANELVAIQDSKTFAIYSESNPEKIYSGKLVYNNPYIEADKRIQLLKIKIENSQGDLIPGTVVSVAPANTSTRVIAVPKSAVLLEKMKTVWVWSLGDNFEQRMVETGIHTKSWIEIKAGLKPGEIFVSEGAYLISSEFILKSGAGQRHEH